LGERPRGRFGANLILTKKSKRIGTRRKKKWGHDDTGASDWTVCLSLRGKGRWGRDNGGRGKPGRVITFTPKKVIACKL